MAAEAAPVPTELYRPRLAVLPLSLAWRETRGPAPLPQVPAYYTNRAFCHLKLENHGLAIADATVALELDRTFVKAKSSGRPPALAGE